MDRPIPIPEPTEEKEVLTLLHHAAWEGNLEVIPFLLAHGYDVNEPTNRSMTPLHSAAISNQHQAAKLLLENKANPNLKNHLGGVPLIYAALNDHVEPARVFVKHGALVDVPDTKGCTALHIAADKGACKVVNLLLTSGANPLAKNAEGQTPLDMATIDVANLIRRHLARRKKPNIKLPPGINN